MDQLHPSGFVETGSCQGPRYIRNQPSRETPGVLLADKYIVEYDQMDNTSKSVDFNLPFRSAFKYTKELQNNWAKLDQDQKNVLMQNLQFLNKNDGSAQSLSGPQYDTSSTVSAPQQDNTGAIIGGFFGGFLFLCFVVYIVGRINNK
jgi:hypothetical protein